MTVPSYPPYQQPLVDPASGVVTRPWQQYFLTLVTATGVGAAIAASPPPAPPTATDIAALGYWTPIMDGATGTLLLTSGTGACVVGFVPTPGGS